MRTLFALFALLLAFATPALAAPYSLGGWTAAAGQPERFRISRTDTTTEQVIDFITRDGTAHAGVDYTASSAKVTLPVGVAAVTVTVPTQVNPAQYGQQLHFGAVISLNGVVLNNAGSTIKEPLQPDNPTVAVDENGAAPIPTTDFDVQTALAPARVPIDNGTDPVGAFRFICQAGPLRYDDPIVYPGKPGASHLHQFYGNDLADAYSTYKSLRTTGSSGCNHGVDATGLHAAQRSAYWMPALLIGNKWVAQPDAVSIYYKRIPASNPLCGDPRTTPHVQGICVGIPNALRFIFGYDMVTNTAPTGGHDFICVTPAGHPVLNSAGQTILGKDLVAFVKTGVCPVGDQLDVRITAPDCWNGHDLDSANHRDHVAYVVADRWTAFVHCPLDHPYLIPRFTMGSLYSVTPEMQAALQELLAEATAGATSWDYTKVLHFSSDEMRPALPPGGTFHADFEDAHDQIEKADWTQSGCVDHHLNCSGGNLGNGQTLKGAAVPSYNGKTSWRNPTPSVPIPARP